MQGLSSILSIIATVALSAIVHAGGGEIGVNDFKHNQTVIYAETLEMESKLTGLVSKTEDWNFGISGKGSIEMNAEPFWASWNLHGVPMHQYRLFEQLRPEGKYAHIKEGSPEYKQLFKEAEQKDEEHKRQVEQDLEKEHKRVGLIADPETETISHFQSGKAKMRVIHCLQGDLKPGDIIEVTWKHVIVKRSCPHITPFVGKCGWSFGKKVQPGDQVDLGHAFFNLDQGLKAKDAYERKLQQAGQ